MTQSNRQFTHVLGTKIHLVNRKEAKSMVRTFMLSDKQHMLATPNPEMLVAAHNDPYFKTILNNSSLNICDGSGLVWALKNKTERIAGVDFMKDICSVAHEENKKIYFLGGGDLETVEKTKEKMINFFPNLKVVGHHMGPKINIRKKESRRVIVADSDINDKVIDDIIMSAPDVLFVAFGHEKQEKWIYEHLPELPSIKIAIGVGGAFNMYAENISRAPKWMQDKSLEWLWRLYKEPKRINRILTATVLFPILVKTKKYANQ